MAIVSGLGIFIILITMTVIEAIYAGNDKNAAGEKAKDSKTVFEVVVSKLPQHVNVAVVLIVVAIPEGLPMTIGISLAFSVMKMFKERILVRKLDAPEKLGGCEEICVGKTATITKNEMKVSYFVLEGNQIKNSRKDTFKHCELSDETIELVKNSILYNCSALVEMV